MIVEIAPALSASGCDAATADGDDIICETYTATIRDPVKPVSPATKMTLTATDKTVTVQHDDVNSPMVSGEDLILARHADGYWFAVKWVC